MTATPPRKTSAKPPRSRAREFAVQALYQHLVGKQDPESIDQFTRGLSGFHKADAVHYDALLHGCIREAAELDALIVPLLDRRLEEIFAHLAAARPTAREVPSLCCCPQRRRPLVERPAGRDSPR